MTSGGNGLQGKTSDAGASGLYGENSSTGGYGAAGRANGTTGIGVLGEGGSAGVKGRSSVFGVYGHTLSAAGVAVYGLAAAIGDFDDLTGTGVLGQSNFNGVGVEGIGGVGHSNNGIGVKGSSQQGVGVKGSASIGVGVLGENDGDGLAVYGYSGAASRPAGPSKTGVFGYANQDANAQGLLGRSALGNGVVGDSASGFGVKGLSGTSAGGYFNSTSGDALVGQILDANSTRTAIVGLATKGVGVSGTATSGRAVSGVASAAGGIGVRAQAPTTGYALDVSGRSRFSRSGKLAIAAGRSSIAKTGVPLTSKSLVLAVLQTNRSGIYVRAVVPNVTGASFTIYLNTRVPGTTYVAWFVIEAP
jgi:hypothetical protein